MLHMIRVAVGIDSVDHLRAVQDVRRAGGDFVPVLTGSAPRRTDEIVAGGSLYWIIKGTVQVRQRIVGIDRLEGRPQGKGCRIRLSPDIVLTAPRPRRPHQGWRYLKPDDAPPDRGDEPEGIEDLPEAMAARLRDLGLV
ncbi:MAG: DUF1489 domain-containing protein [Sphingomonadales bacterium]